MAKPSFLRFNVLVVDDDSTSLAIVSAVLKHWDYDGIFDKNLMLLFLLIRIIMLAKSSIFGHLQAQNYYCFFSTLLQFHQILVADEKKKEYYFWRLVVLHRFINNFLKIPFHVLKIFFSPSNFPYWNHYILASYVLENLCLFHFTSLILHMRAWNFWEHIFFISNRLHSSEDLMNYNTREFFILFLLRHLNRKFIKKKLISCDYHSITTIDSVNLFVCFSYCISSCLFGFLFKDFSNVLLSIVPN